MARNKFGKLERVTAGESLLIDRRRRGDSQLKAARRLGVPRCMYGKMERDMAGPRPTPRARMIKPHERCLLLRRRSGKMQKEIAKDIGICRWWLNQQERGVVPCDELLKYWKVNDPSS